MVSGHGFIKRNRKFINGKHKNIRRKWTSLPYASIAFKFLSRLTISYGRITGRGNARINKIDKMRMQTFTSKSKDNKIPFYTIKSLSKINLKHESVLFPGFKNKCMSNFLSNDDVIANSMSLNESLLSWLNIIRQVRFEPISQRFSNDLINNITKANESKINRHKANQSFLE